MKRIAFLDYLRAIAIFMVFIVHSCENFYFGEDGGLLLQSPESARWTIGIDSAARARTLRQTLRRIWNGSWMNR